MCLSHYFLWFSFKYKKNFDVDLRSTNNDSLNVSNALNNSSSSQNVAIEEVANGNEEE
jgi:hypothetical protein